MRQNRFSANLREFVVNKGKSIATKRPKLAKNRGLFGRGRKILGYRPLIFAVVRCSETAVSHPQFVNIGQKYPEMSANSGPRHKRDMV
jgi:hypothetical protein